MKRIYKLYRTFLIAALITPIQLFAQNTEPINSNYLFERGVTPRILDIAASDLLQDGSFIQNVVIDINDGSNTKQFEIQVIYDPSYQEGMDVRVIFDPSTVSKSDEKELKKLVEKSHSFSRMSRNYLFDESTLKKIKDEKGEVILEYYYQKNDIEPYLKSIKKLKGNVIFKNAELDRVVLTNFKPLKDKVVKMERTVYFEKSNETGGYIKSSSEERHEQMKGGKVIVYTMKTTTTDYYTPELRELTWDGKDSVSPLFLDKKTDTLSVKLGWFLPLLGKPATKLGYKLPRPIGLDAFIHYQSVNMQFTDLTVNIDGGEDISFADLFALDESAVKQSTLVTMAKLDVWILPFLNIMGIYGSGTNNVNGEILVAPEFREFLELIGVENAPGSIPINTDITSTMYGGGATLAGGVGDWNISINYQLMIAVLTEVNTKQSANVITPMIGYMLPFGMNLMVGAQGQFYETKVEGFIDLDDGRRLNYNVDFEPNQWNFMFGIYKGFAKHWEIALQGGVGARRSMTAVFGYRF